MQPPPFNQPYEQAKKPKKNPVLILFAVLGVVLVCCGAPIGFMGYFGYKGFQGAMSMGGCAINASRLATAIEDYSKANNGKLPKADQWQTALSKYMPALDKKEKDAPIKFWTADGEWSCEEDGVKSGFVFNSNYSEKNIKDIKGEEPLVVVFESTKVGFNKNEPYKAQPYELSPKVMGGLGGIKERRGWYVITTKGEVESIGKDGKIVTDNKSFNAGFRKGIKKGQAAAKEGESSTTGE